MQGRELYIGTVCLVLGISSLLYLPTHIENIVTGKGSCAHVLKVAQRAPAIPSAFAEGGIIPVTTRGELTFEDVHFAYPARPDTPVYRGFSLQVGSGRVAALVGESGSGKSTATLLLERFYDPQSGRVLLDGVELPALNVRWLRSQLGLVSQEPVLFQGTVAENIAHGKPGATRAEVEAAAAQANAATFIREKLSDGYDTVVGEKGAQLSGGQKQRIAIARAIIKAPAVLLLDEATSALDSESERLVQAALDEIMSMQERTTLVIAHRLSTIRNADMIAVVSKGCVSETGTHVELLEAGGCYARLVQKQMAMAG